jgi:hypothetical protein
MQTIPVLKGLIGMNILLESRSIKSVLGSQREGEEGAL